MAGEGNPTKIDGCCTPAPAPAPPQRRPRVREVSSRFMSPVVSVSSSTLSGDLHMMSDRSPKIKHSVRSGSIQRRRYQQEGTDATGSGDENENKSDFSKGTPGGFKRPQRAAVKLLFKENNDSRTEQKSSVSDGSVLRSSGGIEVGSRFMAPKRRPDTPNVTTIFDKNRLHRSNSVAATPSAARQLHLSGMPSSAQSSSKVTPDDSDSCSTQHISCRDSITSDTSSVDSSSYSTSPILLQKCRTPRPLPDQIRSSMPESSSTSVIVSSRYLGDRALTRGNSGNSTKMAASPCCRSLNMSMSNGLTNGYTLPPHPPTVKVALDLKARKSNPQLESIHTLKLLHNRYLQWRFSNAKAQASMSERTQEAEVCLPCLII